MGALQFFQLLLVALAVVLFCLTGANVGQKQWWSFGLACMSIVWTIQAGLIF